MSQDCVWSEIFVLNKKEENRLSLSIVSHTLRHNKAPNVSIWKDLYHRNNSIVLFSHYLSVISHCSLGVQIVNNKMMSKDFGRMNNELY